MLYFATVLAMIGIGQAPLNNTTLCFPALNDHTLTLDSAIPANRDLSVRQCVADVKLVDQAIIWALGIEPKFRTERKELRRKAIRLMKEFSLTHSPQSPKNQDEPKDLYLNGCRKKKKKLKK